MSRKTRRGKRGGRKVKKDETKYLFDVLVGKMVVPMSLRNVAILDVEQACPEDHRFKRSK